MKKGYLFSFVILFFLGSVSIAQADSHHSKLQLQFDPSSVTFPDTRVDQTSATQTIQATAVKKKDESECQGSSSNCHGLTIYSVNVSNASFVIKSDQCAGKTLNKGQSCYVQVAFSPTVAGTHRGFLTFLNSGSPGLSFVPLKGKGTAPAVTLSPTVLHFGDQTIGKQSQQSVTVTNSGTADLDISNIAITGDSAFTETNDCLATPIAPTHSCTVTVTFLPTTAGLVSAILNITDDASDSPQTLNMDGTGVNPPVPDVALNPDSLSFGLQQVNNTSAAQSVTVTNIGDAVLNISSITGNSVFAVSSTGTCLSGPIAAGGGTCVFQVTFTPTSAGAQSTHISIVDDATDSPQTVPVSGTGVVPDSPFSDLSTTSLTFGSVAIGSSSAPQTVHLTNTGTSNLVISQVSLEGDANHSYGEEDNCDGVTLGQGEACTFTVVFTPIITGPLGANVTIESNAPNSPQQILLSGTGTSSGGGGSGGGCGCSFTDPSFHFSVLIPFIPFVGFFFVLRRRFTTFPSSGR